MTSNELRKKFLDFFKENGHTIIDSASLVPTDEEQLEGKEKVLFTTAGMQPLIPYLLGKSYPKGRRLVNVQKCLRTDDIEEVGDDTHHTFFEMLGNWSLGDYWKDMAIELSYKFLIEELEIPKEKLAVSVFAGDDDAPKDEESANKWKELGVSEDRIAYLGKEANWWPTNPAAVGPCGPDTEMFIWTGEGQAPEKFDSEDSKWVEVWNDVFMEFNKKEDGTLEELPQKNVDTGMGLERMAAVLNEKQNNYETDLFLGIIGYIKGLVEEEKDPVDLSSTEENLRIIADHIKAATFLIRDGVEPSNKLQGYVLRRLLRRAAVKIYSLGGNLAMKRISELVFPVIDAYKETDYFSNDSEEKIREVIDDEIKRFEQTLEKGLKEIEKIDKIDGKEAFNLYQTFGFPFEVTEEIFKEKGQEINHTEFSEEFKKHQELSRTASAGMFKGGLADSSEIVTKYHTTTHLLHQALRDVLGPEVFQKGSNITSERLRFDFSYDKKMTDEEIKKVEDIINERIEENLQVDHMNIPLQEAKEMSAIGLFNEKYAEKVSIYGVGPDFELENEAMDQRDRGGYYSLEFCGGPHVEHTGVIGTVKIIKEEAVSAGVRRIRAELSKAP
jgi:alanyl-tRNA synthetase